MTVSLLGESFTFPLLARPLTLGKGLDVQYYWMDGAPFRSLKGAAHDTFRTINHHWWAAMQAQGDAADLDQQVHYVAATCYPLVGWSRSLQDVYKDAFLRTGRTRPTENPLGSAAARQIRGIVRKRDAVAVRAELDRTLGRFVPAGATLPLLQEAFRHWVGAGVTALRTGDAAAMEQFLEHVDHWLDRYRKKGKPLVRQFINLFSYEAKVSFYTCYANAWIDIIPVLRSDHGLDEVSERFLRFWHHQNLANDGFDAFNGQVLSLHPLSGFVMKDPALLRIAGRFFGTAAYDRVMTRGEAASCPEYWDLVGVILTAARQYRAALDHRPEPWDGGGDADTPRAPGGGSTGRVRPEEAASAGASEEQTLGALRDYVDGMKLTCSHCGGRLTVADPLVVRATKTAAEIDCVCRRCREPERRVVTFKDMFHWIQA